MVEHRLLLRDLSENQQVVAHVVCDQLLNREPVLLS
jgi:hypothetical protein